MHYLPHSVWPALFIARDANRLDGPAADEVLMDVIHGYSGIEIANVHCLLALRDHRMGYEMRTGEEEKSKQINLN